MAPFFRFVKKNFYFFGGFFKSENEDKSACIPDRRRIRTGRLQLRRLTLYPNELVCLGIKNNLKHLLGQV